MTMLNSVGDWLGTNQAPVTLGNAAAAMMGSAQDSWQAQLGKVASGLGQSKIANEALSEKQKKNDAFRNMLAQYLAGTPGTGVGLTPDGTKGDTSVVMQKNADGTYTRTVKGNSTGEDERRAAGQMLQPTRPVQQPSQPEVGASDFRANPNLVPLF